VSTIAHEDGRTRCSWPGTDPFYVAYHDTDWGVPERDSRALFEKLLLDGFQAGLSWITILRKRENFRRAFDGFEPQRIARYDDAKVAALMADAGIVRNRAKIEAAVVSARAYLELARTQDFSSFLWDFVDGMPVQNSWQERSQVPVETEVSRRMSKALAAKGFKFCGPTIVYAFMQAVGMVNDHFVDCCRHAECAALASPAQISRAKISPAKISPAKASRAKASSAKTSRPKAKASR
jgi:DNA-3-methyladenine glycosylase I